MIQRALSLILFIYAMPALACPEIGGMVDYNCDGRHVITVIGDSIVNGLGDNVTSGYVGRLARRTSTTRFNELGYNGITTIRLYAEMKQTLLGLKGTERLRMLRRADIIVIDVGRNDFFANSSSGNAARNIERIGRTLHDSLGRNGTAPLIFASLLISTRRGYQQPYVLGINNGLRALSTKVFPALVPMNTFHTSGLSSDGLHPNPAGYREIADILDHFLEINANRIAAKRRPDVDNDGIYNLFEKPRFLTDSHLFDSDFDGYSDGTEVFTLKSNPNDPADPPL